jgi:hypothetical protein
MAELPQLRDNADNNGDSAMRLSDTRRANLSEAVFVLGGTATTERGRPAVEAANVPAGRGVDRDIGARISRAAGLAALSVKDREVFKLWGRRVIALYSLIIVGLVMAMLLVSYSATEQEADATPPATAHASSVASAPDLGRTGK